MTLATGHTKQTALENARAKLDAAAQQILNLKTVLFAYEGDGHVCADIDLEPTDRELRYVVYDAITTMSRLFQCDELYYMAIDPEEYDEEEARAEQAADRAYEFGKVV